jgi:RNA recognition motif-containing protein
MSTRLYVGNLPFSTTSDSLQQMFSQVGEVASSQVITDKFSGRSKGFGFVEMQNVESATAAITKFNGTDLDGRPLTVSEAKPRETREGGGGGGGGDRGGRGGGFGGDRGSRGGGFGRD